MSKRYSVFLARGNSEVRLGELTFDDDNNGVLSLGGATPDHRQLAERWETVKALDGIAMEWRKREKDASGNWVTYNLVDEVGKDSPDYTAAVVYHMDVTYGYQLYTLPDPDK